VCLLVALASRAVAGEPLPLQQITVEASPIDPYLPARTEVDRSEIIDAHQSELSDVLELTPGINVRQGGKGEVRVDMRGFDQRATLYTLDGVPVYEPYNGIINADLFPLEMLNSIEITRGASSSLYGPNGMGGQIKLDTFAPRPPLGAAVSTIWRDSDLCDVRASGSAAHEGWSGFAAGRYLTSSGLWLSDDFQDRPDTQRRFQNGSKRVNSDVDQLSGFASLGYQYGNGGRAHVAVLASDATFGIPPSTTQFGQLLDSGQYAPIIERADPERLLHVQAGFEQRILPTIGVAGGLFYTSYDYHDTQYFPQQKTKDDPLDYSRVATIVTNSHELGGIGRVTLDVGDRDTIAVGGQVRGDSVDLSTTTRGFLGSPSVTVASVGVENVYAATDRISLVLGASEDLQTGGRIGTRSEFDPQGIVSIDLDQWGAARVAVARKIRFPTLRELFDKYQGNPHLAPENTLTYEIGYRVSRRWGYAGLNLFRSDVDNLIAGGGDDNHFINVQTATLQGIEVASGVMPVERVRLDITYTYLDTTANNSIPLSPSSDSAVQHKPAHRFNGILQVSLPWELLLRMEGIYTSEQLDRLNSDVMVGGFGLWNVQITRPVGKWLSVFAGADNLLDTDYEQKLGTPESGRRAFAGFRATY
jgi:vitamin B12 transporter